MTTKTPELPAVEVRTGGDRGVSVEIVSTGLEAGTGEPSWPGAAG